MCRTRASNQGEECREYYPRLRDVTVKAVFKSAAAQQSGFSPVAPVRQRACPGPYQLFEECFHIKHRLSCEDVIGSSGHFVSHDGQRFCLSMFFLESGAIKFCLFISSQEEDDGFGEGPLEVNIADLSAGAPHFLSGRFLGGFYEPAVGSEILDFWKALDVMDFVKDGKAKDAPYSRNGSYSEVGIAVMFFGESGYFLFEIRKDRVVEVEKVEVELDTLLDAPVRKELSDSLSLGFSADVVFNIRQVVLIGRILDVSQKFSSLAGEIHSSPEQIAGGAHFWRVDVGHGEHPPSGEYGNLVGIDSVVLRFSTVDGFHIECMAKDETDTFFLAQISQPIPGEGTLNSDDKIIPVLLDRFQEYLPVSLDVSMEKHRALAVNNAQIHGFCVQVDSAIIPVLFRVEFHSASLLCCGDLHHTFGYEQGGLNEYQGAVADMAHLQRRPRVPKIREIEAFVLRAGTQVRHAAKLWR